MPDFCTANGKKNKDLEENGTKEDASEAGLTEYLNDY